MNQTNFTFLLLILTTLISCSSELESNEPTSKPPTTSKPFTEPYFPNWAPDNYIGELVELKISQDTTIDLRSIDPKMKGDITFNWEFDEIYYSSYIDSSYESKQANHHKIIGIRSFETESTNKVVHHLDTLINIEAFSGTNKNSYYYNRPFKKVTFQDINFDGYLDLAFERYGSSILHTYFTYVPETHSFKYEPNLRHLNAYYADFDNKILYSWDGGTATLIFQSKYELVEGELRETQRQQSYSTHLYSYKKVFEGDSVIYFTSNFDDPETLTKFSINMPASAQCQEILNKDQLIECFPTLKNTKLTLDSLNRKSMDFQTKEPDPYMKYGPDDNYFFGFEVFTNEYNELRYNIYPLSGNRSLDFGLLLDLNQK